MKITRHKKAPDVFDAAASRIALGWLKFSRALSLVVVATPLAFAAPSASSAGSSAPSAAEELDRPGEVENPFSLGAGKAEVVGYILAANPRGREANELGTGGSATIFQTGVRFGVGHNWEGQIFADTYLNAIDKGPDGDDPGHARAGLGFLTFRAKAQLIGTSTSEAGLAVVPFVRLPINHALTGRSGAEPGIIVAYDLDLEHGFELQGSTGITLSHGDNGDRSAEWETQTSLEWHFLPAWTAYIEPQLVVGQGRPAWALEQGISVLLSKAWHFDVGYNFSVGHPAGGRFGYVGIGVAF